MTQFEALEILKMGNSVFLTGAAGTGKTYVLNEYIKYLKRHNIFPAITASTGIAATHIGGQTIHSWSGIGIYEKLDRYTLDKLEQREKLWKRYQEVKVLIIDEISMLHSFQLDMINTLFKKFRSTDKPFGGIQIIFCGDFFQLPPVIRKELLDSNEKHFAYHSKAWQELNPVICYLTENYRQEDNELNSLLNNIRYQNNLDEVYKKLESKSNLKKDNQNKKEILKLYTHNVDVDQINQEKYNLIDTDEEYIYEMTTLGKSNIIESLKNNCLALETLKLKIGTKVIFIRNDQYARYQNGTLGTVVAFDDYNMPIVETYNGEKITVSNDTWEYLDEEGKKSLASISQIPLRLAYAITIHKSQGMTLDAAEIDLSKAFGFGMGYVALSRVKKMKNINLLGFSTDAIKMNQEILKQDKIFIEKSLRAEKALEKYLTEKNKPTKELIKKQENFIEKCYGNIKEIDIEDIKIEKPKEKIKTIFITLPYIKEKLSLTEIAKERNLTLGTILSHIEELLEIKEIELSDISYLLKEIKKEYKEKELKIIKEVLNEDTGLKAKHIKLKDKYHIDCDYNILKLLRLEIEK